MRRLVSWIYRVMVSVDQLVNVILGPTLNVVLNPSAMFGNEDETLSSVLGKNVRAGSCRACYFVCRALHLIDKNHCRQSIEDDE